MTRTIAEKKAQDAYRNENNKVYQVIIDNDTADMIDGYLLKKKITKKSLFTNAVRDYIQKSKEHENRQGENANGV